MLVPLSHKAFKLTSRLRVLVIEEIFKWATFSSIYLLPTYGKIFLILYNSLFYLIFIMDRAKNIISIEGQWSLVKLKAPNIIFNHLKTLYQP